VFAALRPVTTKGDGGVAAKPQDTDVTGSAFSLPQCSPRPSGNRQLATNQLTSLEVGVFDKNTALKYMYVDPSAKGWDMPLRRLRSIQRGK
jgi:hypothetical protein